MTLSCGVCKRFIAAASALHCERNPKHAFHEECISALSDSVGACVDTSGPLCPICKIHVLFRRRSAAALGDGPDAVDGVAAGSVEEGTGSLKTLITSLLQKVTSIENRLLDLTSIKTQLSSLELGVQNFTSSLNDFAVKTDDLSSVTCRLQDQDRYYRARQCIGVGASFVALGRGAERFAPLIWRCDWRPLSAINSASK